MAMVTVKDMMHGVWCDAVDEGTVVESMVCTHSTHIKKKFRGKASPSKNMTIKELLEKTSKDKLWNDPHYPEWMYCPKRNILVKYAMVKSKGRFYTTELTRITLKGK